VLDHLLALDQRQRRKVPVRRVLRPHVVRVRQAEVVVESVPGRQELRVVAQVPLTVDRGRVAPALEQLGEGRLGRADAGARPRPERAEDADAIRVAAGQQRGAGSGADRLRRVELGQPDPFPRQPVQVRRRDPPRPEAAEVRVAQVIGENQDDVRRSAFGVGRSVFGRCDANEEQRRHQQQQRTR
jgi:hypothetical protein